MRAVGWTGQRPDLFADPAAARAAVEALAREHVAEIGASGLCFLVGGQRGVDTWAAAAGISLGVDVEVVLPLPPDVFAADWAEGDRAALRAVLTVARRVEVVDGHPDLAYAERNRRLAARGERLMAVWTGVGEGGTAETIRLARSMGTPVEERILPAAPGAEGASGRGL